MKKWLLPMILMSNLSLTAGGCTPGDKTGNGGNSAAQSDPAAEKPGLQSAGRGSSLVVYFSCTNTTGRIADRIADATDAAVWRIEPVAAYTSEDLNYNNSSSRANREQNDPSARPAIKRKCETLADCDVVFLGYPIWWGKAPKVIFTFLETHDLAGKTLVPFCTSGGSGIGSSAAELHALAPQAEWKRGRRFSGNESKETIENWIGSLALEF